MKNNNKKKKSTMWFWVIFIIAILLISLIVVLTTKGTTELMSWSDFENQYNQGNIYYYTIAKTSGGGARIDALLTSGTGLKKVYVNTMFERIPNVMLDHAGSITTYVNTTFSDVLIILIQLLLPIVLFIGVFYFLIKSTGGMGSNSPFGMSKNKARQQKSDIKFSDVAGINEEKAELVELVDYLKNPAKYAEFGARAPKGVLMEGPPGTGKTLLAKAVAGEANVAFFSIAGSEFEEMFVGLGASRVREMFNDAKKVAPAIIFIDEIDAVGRKRNSGMGSSGNEQTLNQLLVEMDGFGTNSGIIVMAATNRADVLDSALLRPGRFDRTIQISLPDIKERKAILELHARNKKVDDSVDWHRVAERTPGFSGAQLENVLNEAAILIVREGKKIITINEIDEAIDRVVGGPAKKSRAMTQQDKSIVSYHESGHALVGLKLENASKVQKVTIIPRGNAGGYTIMTPKDETIFSSKKDLLAMIAGYMGGRAAEEIKFGKDNVTTGAHDDLDKATNIARRMIVQFGMSENLGMTKYLTMAEESYGKLEGTYSDETAAKIDLEISKILDDAYLIALKTIKSNMNILELLAESLRILETITAEQIEYINQHNKLPDEVVLEKEIYEKIENKKSKGEIIELD